MKDKIAYHLKKGDVILLDKERVNVETVICKDEDRLLEVTVRTNIGKKIAHFKWNELVPLWEPPKKTARYKLLFFLSRFLGAPIKRA